MAGHHGGKKIVIIAFAMNMCIAVVKTGVAFLTGSSAMLAEAIHSWADSGNQVLLLVGLHLSAKPPDEKYPYGRGKESYFWSFLVAVFLFTLGACYSIYEGVHKLMHPGEGLQNVGWAYAVLSIGVVLESVALRAALKEILAQRGDMTILGFLRESKNAELVVVFMEDVAAQCGLLIALAGLVLAQMTGVMWFDSAASIGVGLVLGAVAYFLAVEIKSLLVGEAAGKADAGRVLACVKSFSSVRQVERLHTLQMGADKVLVCLEVDFENRLTVEELEREIEAIKSAIVQQMPAAFQIYIMPADHIS